MKKLFSVGEAAKITKMTSETLRHYDRIGLVHPNKIDEFSKYRYYDEQDIVRLNTVRALQQMDLPLKEIKEVLEFDDLQKIVDYLERAERKADEKIAAIQYSKSKILLAKSDYENKLMNQNDSQGFFIKNIPARVIMLSDTLEAPSLDNLWNYLSHFYSDIDPLKKELFSFEDLAGVYTQNGISRLFAVCTRYSEVDGLINLPKGKYLCAYCSEEKRQAVLQEILQIAKVDYYVEPNFIVEQIIVSGILQWKYQVQVFIEK